LRSHPRKAENHRLYTDIHGKTKILGYGKGNASPRRKAFYGAGSLCKCCSRHWLKLAYVSIRECQRIETMINNDIPHSTIVQSLKRRVNVIAPGKPEGFTIVSDQ
jgi:hypothetical protein